MLSVLLLVAAAIAYIYLHKAVKSRRQNTSWHDDEDEVVNTARSVKSADWLFACKPTSDVYTASSPTGGDYWDVPVPSTDVCTARMAMSFDFIPPERHRSSLNNVYTARSAYSIDAIPVKSVENLQTCLSDYSASIFDVKAKILQEEGQLDLEPTKWCDEDLVTCVSDELHTALEKVEIANLKEDDSSVDDKYRFVNCIPRVPPDPATRYATKSMKRRIRRQNRMASLSSTSASVTMNASEENFSAVMDEAPLENWMAKV